MPVSPLAAVPTRLPPVERRRSGWPLAAGALFLLGMVVVGRVFDVGLYGSTAQEWAGALGMLAPAAYILVYVAVTLVGMPSAPFALFAPVLFGAVVGIVVMVVASTMSAALAFLIARYLAREAVAERLAGTVALARLPVLVQNHDWILIPLLRVFPIAPFAVVNYGFGLTEIAFWRYLGWSALAMVPSTVALVLGVHFFYGAATRWAGSWLLLGAATVAVLAVIGLFAVVRRARPWLVKWFRGDQPLGTAPYGRAGPRDVGSRGKMTPQGGPESRTSR